MITNYSIQLHLTYVSNRTHTAHYSNGHGIEFVQPVIGIPPKKITINITANITKEELNNV